MDPHEASHLLWNAVESLEKRKDAQVAREVEFSLPHELTKEQRLALAREFIGETFTAHGMIADWVVHNHFDEKDGIEKPHVHVMLTTRVLQETDENRRGFGPKERYGIRQAGYWKFAKAGRCARISICKGLAWMYGLIIGLTKIEALSLKCSLNLAKAPMPGRTKERLSIDGKRWPGLRLRIKP